MTLSLQNLWSKVLSSSANTLCLIWSNNILLGQSKVSNLDITICSHQNIFRFQITIENILRMKMMQCKKNIRGIKSCCVLFKSTNLREIEEKFSTRTILKNKEELTITLECVIHLYYKRMSDIFL